MSVRDDKRGEATQRIADHLLAHGLAEASLRPMAEAAGVSDRMLLYYFEDKTDVLAAALGEAADRLAGILEAGEELEAQSGAGLVQVLWRALQSPAVKPYMHLWLEIVARSARDEAPYREIAGRIGDSFLDWLSGHVIGGDVASRRARAALVLAIIDGLAQIEAAGRPEIAEAALSALSRSAL